MTKRLLIVAVAVAFVPSVVSAAVLFSDDMTNATAWGMNASSADTAATFNYNYAADGIPEAPHPIMGGAATRGVKLEANIIDPAAGEKFTLYPLGQNFTGNHQLRFDAWMNFDADTRATTGAGTTEFLGGGVGYDNVTVDVASGAQTIATGEGGSASDWRAFKSPPQFFVASADMNGGTRQGSSPYYANFLPSVAPPPDQGQAASGVAGSPGFQWITWVFTAINQGGLNKVRVSIEKPDGSSLSIVKMNCNFTGDGSNGCTSEGNISLFYADFFSSVSSRPDLTFGVIDNVIVTDVPEPASLSLLALGGLAILRRRR